MFRGGHISFAALLTLILAPPLGAAANLWDDRPMRIVQTTEGLFPMSLMQQGVREGEVRAVLHIDADGRLMDFLVTAYSHPELLQEAITSIRHWEYEPARQRGQTVGTRSEVILRFESRGAVVSLTASDTVATTLNRLTAMPMNARLCKLPELDEPPALVHVVQPYNPGKRAGVPQGRGRATVDFYIDPEGRPRMPVVTRSSHEAFALAAYDAVSQWRFTPPTRRGEPVMVRVVQEFVFPEST